MCINHRFLIKKNGWVSISGCEIYSEKKIVVKFRGIFSSLFQELHFDTMTRVKIHTKCSIYSHFPKEHNRGVYSIISQPFSHTWENGRLMEFESRHQYPLLQTPPNTWEFLPTKKRPMVEYNFQLLTIKPK